MFAGAVALLWTGAGPRELTKNDEFRYVTVAREFVIGGDWFYCRLNGATYDHKPPGFFWSVAWMRLAGFDLATGAKLVSVLAAAGAATLVFDLARRLWGRTAAWTAAVALLTMKGFFTICVRAQLDPSVALWTTLATYCFARAVLFDATERERTRWTAAAFLAAGFGMLVKGPVAYAIPGSAAVVALLWNDRWRETPWWRWVLGIVVLVVPVSDYGLPVHGPLSLLLRFAAFAAITGFWRSDWRALRTRRWALAPLALLPGLVWAVLAASQAPEGWGYVRALAFGQGVGHAAGEVDKFQPWWFFAKSFPFGLMPWTFLLPAAVWALRAQASPDRARVDRFALAWVVAPLVVMSLSIGKRDLYIVPVYPAAALLFGRLAMTVVADESRLAKRPVAWGLRATAVVGLAIAAVLLAVGVSSLAGADGWIDRLWEPWNYVGHRMPSSVPTAAVAIGAAVAAASVVLLRARTIARVTASLGAIVVALTLSTALVYAPYTEAMDSPREFLERVKARIGSAYLGDYGAPERAANLFCDRSVVPMIMNVREAERVLLGTPGRVYLVIDREWLARRGMPAGATVLMEDEHPGPQGLVLIGRE